MVNEIHRHPLARRIAKFCIEDMRLDELRVLVAEGYGLSYAEDGWLPVVKSADVVFGGAEEDEARVNALLRDNLGGIFIFRVGKPICRPLPLPGMIWPMRR